MQGKWIIIVVSSVLLLGALLWFGVNLAPGSYPFVEKYVVDAPEAEVIKAIGDFKRSNPQYEPPSIAGLNDGRDTNDKRGHWYHIYFYYKETDEIVYAWTRPETRSKTTMALVGINKGVTLVNWKRINDDFSRSENALQKARFEQQVLAPIISITGKRY